jgi:DNA repair exonuclease SbcCD nuclease subunit
VLTEFFIRFKNLNIIINLGNHDLDGDNSVITPLIRLSGNDNHKVITEPTKIMGDHCYHFIPYYNEAKTIAVLNNHSMHLCEERKNILFVHHSFKNSSFANNIKVKSGINQNYFMKGNFSKYDLIIASHIHKYQELFGGKGFYTSSLIPIDFGERSKEHGYHVVDVDNDKRYFVIPKAPKFVYIKTSSEMNDNELKKKTKGNIVMVINDNDKGFSKEETRNKILGFGARFVAFKNKIKRSNYKENISKISTRKTEAIVSEYSDVLAKRFSIEKEEVEKIGLGFLEKAKKEEAIESQRR